MDHWELTSKSSQYTERHYASDDLKSDFEIFATVANLLLEFAKSTLFSGGLRSFDFPLELVKIYTSPVTPHPTPFRYLIRSVDARVVASAASSERCRLELPRHHYSLFACHCESER
jgi:hypothetical protein